MGDGVQAALTGLSPLLRTAHLHDNHGERDEHLWPGEGTIDFDAVFDGLKKAPQKPAGVLEIHYSHGAEPAQVVERAKAAFAKFD
jgi:sugar phosphate isomerase/epimerase